MKTKEGEGTSLVVQWLKRHVPNAGSPGSIPGQGTRSCMPQLDPWCPNSDPAQLKKKKGKGEVEVRSLFYQYAANTNPAAYE